MEFCINALTSHSTMEMLAGEKSRLFEEREAKFASLFSNVQFYTKSKLFCNYPFHSDPS